MGQQRRHKTGYWISFFALSFLLAGCSPDSPERPWYKLFRFHIQGTVTDSTTGAPVVAHVDFCTGLMGWVTGVDTNNLGQYVLDASCSESPDTGEWFFWLAVSAPGYKTKAINSESSVHVRITEELQTIDVQLEPEALSLKSPQVFRE